MLMKCSKGSGFHANSNIHTHTYKLIPNQIGDFFTHFSVCRTFCVIRLSYLEFKNLIFNELNHKHHQLYIIIKIR